MSHWGSKITLMDEMAAMFEMGFMERSWKRFFLLWYLRNKNREQFVNTDPISLRGHWKWWRGYWKGFQLRKTYLYEIRWGGKLAGFMGRTFLNSDRDRVEIGQLLLRRKFRGKGIMAHAVGLMTSDGMRSYCAEVLESNTASRNVFVRSDFKVNGYVRKDGRIFKIFIKERSK